MSHARRTPRPRWLAVLVPVAVVVAALVVDTSSEPASEPPPVGPPPTEPVRVATVAEFCDAFAYLAASYTDQVANPDRDTAAPLEAAGAELRAVGRPPGMTDLDAAGLDVFVDDTLEPFRHLATPGATPESATASRSGEDQLALERFNAFVSATCTPT